jgi:DNA-binding IclR family transcriptional regulator
MHRTVSALDETKVTRTLSRGLDVLEALARGDEHGIGPTAIGQRVSLDKATVMRLLRTLVDAGYVTQDPATRYYRLTGRILWLAHLVTARLDLRSVARSYLTALRDELGETVHLGVMEDLGVVYVDKLEAVNSIQLVSAIGQTMPLHSTSLGKALLAALPDAEREGKYVRMDFLPRTDRTIRDLAAFRSEILRTQERGYSTDDRENEPFGACVGAAIVGADGRPVGAISVAGPYFRIHDRLEYFGGRVHAVAGAIARELGADVADDVDVADPAGPGDREAREAT